MRFLLLFFLFTHIELLANEPVLEISSPELSVSYKYQQLIDRDDLEHISIAQDPSYQNKAQTFRAIRLLNLFKQFKLKANMVVQFNCTDGFSAPMDTSLLLNTSQDKALAYLAIENPKQKWAPLPNKKLSAGPFRIIWLNPEKSHIVQEQWPYMIHSFEIKGTLKASYPLIFPSKELAKDHNINKGFKVFLNNCFVCHKLNGQGSASIGPDLNHPMNPTEYFKSDALKKLIRDPKSVRTWKSSKMPDFSKDEISEIELEQLISYLEHMKERK